MTQEILIYEVKVKAERTFNILLAVDAPHQTVEFAKTLVSNKFVPGIYKVQGFELRDILQKLLQ